MNATQPKARKPRPKPARSIRILENAHPDDPYGFFAVQIAVGKLAVAYLCHEIPTDFAAGQHGYEVEKLDAEGNPTGTVYHVLFDEREATARCDCKGGEQHGHCKHGEGLAALHRAGRI